MLFPCDMKVGESQGEKWLNGSRMELDQPEEKQDGIVMRSI